MRDQLTQLLGSDAVLQCKLHVRWHVQRSVSGHQGCDGDQAPVPLAEPGAVPDVAEEHVPGELCQHRGAEAAYILGVLVSIAPSSAF